MDKASRNKWQVRGAAILIFVLGFAAGLLALGAYRAWDRRPAASGDRFNQMATRLQLNADQKTKVQEIFGDTRQQLQGIRKESESRVNEIRQQTDQKLQQVLTQDQWKKFQQMRDEGRARRGSGGRNDGR